MNRSAVVLGFTSAWAVTVLFLWSPTADAQSGTKTCDFSPSPLSRPECSADDLQPSKTLTISGFLLKDMKAAQDAQKAQNWSLEVQPAPGCPGGPW
jgi:hypothetical protein